MHLRVGYAGIRRSLESTGDVVLMKRLNFISHGRPPFNCKQAYCNPGTIK
jgi:hypothetical protein